MQNVDLATRQAIPFVADGLNASYAIRRRIGRGIAIGTQATPLQMRLEIWHGCGAAWKGAERKSPHARAGFG